MNKITFAYLISLCMLVGFWNNINKGYTDENNEPVVSNLAINIKCSPEQEITNVEQKIASEANTNEYESPTSTTDVEVAIENKNNSFVTYFKYAIVGAAVAGAGFYRKTVQKNVINIAEKIRMKIF